jgi:hypothetical protein
MEMPSMKCAFYVVVLLCPSWCEFVAAAESKIVATGDWSAPVKDKESVALRGRLVLCESNERGKAREAAVFVELQEASGSDRGVIQVYCDMASSNYREGTPSGLECQLRDNAGNAVKDEPFFFSGGIPQSQWVVLPPQASIRLRATPFGIRHEKDLIICPSARTKWVIGANDESEYVLTGKFSVPPARADPDLEAGYIWNGTIELPGLRIRSTRP